MDRLDALDAIEATVWAELARAPRQRAHGWRVGVLATVDGDGADARSVVLREVDPARRELVFFADSRSRKVQQLQACPRGTLVLWSEPLGWQLRLKVALQVQTTGLAVSSRWARLKMSPAAHDYLSPMAPGTPLGQPGNERGSRTYFAVVTAKVTALDWLELHADGHRRALFDDQGARWVQP